MNEKNRKPFVLVILDGWGISPERRGNAILLGKLPVYNDLWNNYPHSQLQASSRQVGLPSGQDGNSEAGHSNIGGGRIVEQESVKISKAINDGTFFRNPAFITAIDHIKRNGSNLHLIGLLTASQSAHSDPDHFLALITLLRIRGIKNVFLHFFTDGRDSYQYLGLSLLKKLKNALINNEQIATISGRFYAMDRIKEWKRTELAYNAMVLGKGRTANDFEQAISQAYNNKETDEYIVPTVLNLPGRTKGRILDDDAVIFFNLRSDRARQLTRVFTEDNFEGFRRKKSLKNLCFVTLTDFGQNFPGVIAAYPSRVVINSLPFALKGLKQLYIAETEKYAHVTYFFNGGYEQPLAGEDRIIIKSPHVYSYKEQPEMSAVKITDAIVQSINEDRYDFITVNYANPDMVGHTGDIPACVKAVETVDQCLGRLRKVIEKKAGTIMIIADHGNVEELIDLKTGQVDTKHSSNPVPCIIFNQNIPRNFTVENGILGDVAPTILYMLGVVQPRQMGNKVLCQYNVNQNSN